MGNRILEPIEKADQHPHCNADQMADLGSLAEGWTGLLWQTVLEPLERIYIVNPSARPITEYKRTIGRHYSGDAGRLFLLVPKFDVAGNGWWVGGVILHPAMSVNIKVWWTCHQESHGMGYCSGEEADDELTQHWTIQRVVEVPIDEYKAGRNGGISLRQFEPFDKRWSCESERRGDGSGYCQSNSYYRVMKAKFVTQADADKVKHIQRVRPDMERRRADREWMLRDRNDPNRIEWNQTIFTDNVVCRDIVHDA